MRKNERVRGKYPSFFLYGRDHSFLDAEACGAASTEERIKSIWPFIVVRVTTFAETLKPREKVNFDPEDVISECWIALAERDHLWTPERGKYITFAGTIIDHEMFAIRDKARTVESPRNSSCRMKQYQKEEDAGTISPRRAKTANDIRRSGDPTKEISPGFREEPIAMTGPCTLTAAESQSECLDAIKTAIRQLPPSEAFVLGRLSGLFGREPWSVWRLAWATERSEGDVRRAKSRAMRKVRKILADRDLSVTYED